MTDDQPIFVADQANTSASATTILSVLTTTFSLLCFRESDHMADVQPIVVADQANTNTSASTILADQT